MARFAEPFNDLHSEQQRYNHNKRFPNRFFPKLLPIYNIKHPKPRICYKQLLNSTRSFRQQRQPPGAMPN